MMMLVLMRIVLNLSIDLDLPLSRLVSLKLSRIRLHHQDDHSGDGFDDDGDVDMLNSYPSPVLPKWCQTHKKSKFKSD